MNQIAFKKIALAASIMLALAFTFGCSDSSDSSDSSGSSGSSDDKEDGGSNKEKWCVGSLMSIDGYKSCYKIGIKSQALNLVVTEEYCNAYSPLMAVTEEAPNKADCGAIYEDGTECILFGYDEDMAKPCSDGLDE